MGATHAAVAALLACAALAACAQPALARTRVQPLFRHGRPTGGALNLPLSAAISAAADGAATAPAPQLMEQRVDHFDPQNSATWKQRYWVNETHFAGAGKGPLFVQISGEAPFDPIWVQADVESMVNAQAFGAVVAAVEHRFYGGSQPFGDLSTDHLRYLSSQQALADLAATITALQAKYKPTATVVFGGSYSGALAGWFRTKYPHLADVGVATSSPVLAELDFIEYLEVVTASLGDSLVGGSAACTKAITDATSTIQQMATTDDGLAQLSSKFNTCEKLSTASSAQDIQNFFSTIIGSFMGVVQYNLDNRAFEHPGAKFYSVSDVCQMMTSASDPLDGYAAVSAAVNFEMAGGVPAHAGLHGLKAGSEAVAGFKDGCLDVSYDSMITAMQNTSLASGAAEGGRQWVYQTCSQFAYFQTTDGPAPAQIFGPSSFIPVSFYAKMCSDIYGDDFNAQSVAANVEWTNEYYGGVDLSGTNILVPNGSIDPWHALSITSPPGPQRDSVVPIFIQGTAHCANMYPASSSDLPGLTAARKEITNQLGKWLPAPSTTA